ncbi:MAG: hypothetical protein L3J41_05635 [Melioribacteraceae bacterium]|nr:hypothetical protein [Melioribacteraceae bacterium]
MEFHKISVEVSEGESANIKKFIVSLGDIRSSVSVKKSESNKDLKTSFYTFSIETDVIKDFLLKFNKAHLKAVSQDEMNEKLRTSIQSNAAYNSAVNSAVSSDDLKGIRKRKTLDDFISEGNYAVLLDMIRNIRLEENKRHRAEMGIPTAVKRAIEISFEEGESGKRGASSALEELINIATNAQLKNLRLNHILINAGQKAIEICTLYEDFADELIKIGNNIKMPNIISINSVVKFSSITLRDDRNFKPEYEADINIAIKNTNLRWLRMAYDSVEHEISDEDKKLYERFISFIEYKKLGN